MRRAGQLALLYRAPYVYTHIYACVVGIWWKIINQVLECRVMGVEETVGSCYCVGQHAPAAASFPPSIPLPLPSPLT